MRRRRLIGRGSIFISWGSVLLFISYLRVPSSYNPRWWPMMMLASSRLCNGHLGCYQPTHKGMLMLTNRLSVGGKTVLLTDIVLETVRSFPLSCNQPAKYARLPLPKASAKLLAKSATWSLCSSVVWIIGSGSNLICAIMLCLFSMADAKS